MGKLVVIFCIGWLVTGTPVGGAFFVAGFALLSIIV